MPNDYPTSTGTLEAPGTAHMPSYADRQRAIEVARRIVAGNGHTEADVLLLATQLLRATATG